MIPTKITVHHARFKNQTFDIEHGKLHALIGENEAGKTTLLNLLHEATQYHTQLQVEGGSEPRNKNDVNKYLTSTTPKMTIEYQLEENENLEVTGVDDQYKLQLQDPSLNVYVEYYILEGGEKQTLVYYQSSKTDGKTFIGDQGLQSKVTRNIPKFILLGPQDLDIQTAIDVASVKRRNPNAITPATQNLLNIAGQDSIELGFITNRTIEDNKYKELQEQSNRNLQRFFAGDWNRFGAEIHLDPKPGKLVLRIRDQQQNEDQTCKYYALNQRSAGFRQLVAINAYLAQHKTDNKVKPILLIDEIETHLHVNAQVSLIDSLQNYQGVSKVIYSTHSPASLPPDLGTGIIYLNKTNIHNTQIQPGFWNIPTPGNIADVGYENLMYAMGASSARFAVYKKTVIAEGISEMLLLPAAIRHATGEPYLNYHIAGGLSSYALTKRGEPATVGYQTQYLVDGDGEGNKYVKQLHDLDVHQDRIHQLPANISLEELFTTTTLLGALKNYVTQHNLTQITKEDETYIATKLANKEELFAKILETLPSNPDKKINLTKTVFAKILYNKIRNHQPNTPSLLTKEGQELLKNIHERIENNFLENNS